CRALDVGRMNCFAPVPRLPFPIRNPHLPTLFNSHLQWHSHDLLLVPELAPDLVAASLRKRVHKANIRAIGHARGQYAAGRHWADSMDMRKNSAGGIACDHMPGHT